MSARLRSAWIRMAGSSGSILTCCTGDAVRPDRDVEDVLGLPVMPLAVEQRVASPLDGCRGSRRRRSSARRFASAGAISWRKNIIDRIAVPSIAGWRYHCIRPWSFFSHGRSLPLITHAPLRLRWTLPVAQGVEPVEQIFGTLPASSRAPARSARDAAPAAPSRSRPIRRWRCG